MGSATTQALAASVATLDSVPHADLGIADQLFQAARAIGAAPQLSGSLADPAAAVEARTKIVTDIFEPSFSPETVSLLKTVASERWSNPSDLVDAIEELAVRAAVDAANGADVEGELFEVSRTVAANPELELALGSRLGDSSKKGDLVRAVFAGKASDATTLIVASLVRQPSDRRVRQLLSRALRIAAAQRGRSVATVTTAVSLTPEQSAKLAALLSNKYGREVALNTVIDPKVVGGLRVQVADDVIDASIAARLADLRQRLAG